MALDQALFDSDGNNYNAKTTPATTSKTTTRVQGAWTSEQLTPTSSPRGNDAVQLELYDDTSFASDLQVRSVRFDVVGMCWFSNVSMV